MDKKAKKILLDTFWSSTGWKKGFKIDVDDFAYAKSKGLMFDPLHIKHDELVEWLLKGYTNTSKRVVTDTFLASLSKPVVRVLTNHTNFRLMVREDTNHGREDANKAVIGIKPVVRVLTNHTNL